MGEKLQDRFWDKGNVGGKPWYMKLVHGGSQGVFRGNMDDEDVKSYLELRNDPVIGKRLTNMDTASPFTQKYYDVVKGGEVKSLVKKSIEARSVKSTLFKGSGKDVKVVYLDDGDSGVINLPHAHPKVGNRVGFRLFGIDTAEKVLNYAPGADTSHKRLNVEEARKAQAYFQSLIDGGKNIRIEDKGLGKYGRKLVKVYVDGLDVVEDMIEKGYGVRFEYLKYR